MIWFFERPGERLQCEIRQSVAGTGYELVWVSGDGRTHVEHSVDLEALLRRRRALENWLTHDGWVRHPRITPQSGHAKPRPQWPARRSDMH